MLELFINNVRRGYLPKARQYILVQSIEEQEQALIWCCQNGYNILVNFLIEKGVNVNAQNNLALIYACQNDYPRIVQLLINNGADVNAQDTLSLIAASLEGYYEIVEILVNSGANVNAQNSEALILASLYGRYEVVKFLIDNGANINDQNDQALISASDEGYLEIVKLLVDNGANISSRNYFAITLASQNKHLDVVQYLNGIINNELDNMDVDQDEDDMDVDEDNNEINIIKVAPENNWKQEVIRDFNFQHVCNSYNEFSDQGPLDPITYEPIPSNLFVSVKSILDTEYKNTTCFNAESLYNHWLYQSQNNKKIKLRYANNPLNLEYFDQQSVDYVINMLFRLE